MDWRSYMDMQLWVLGGSIALLIVALVLKFVQGSRGTGEPEPLYRSTAERFTRRIGTMPLEPEEPAGRA